MKKVLKLLLLAFISLAVMGCSDSDDTFQAGIVGYETFSTARNAWKEPTSYSYTVHGGAWQPEAFVIDVKVTNGVTEFSLNSSFPRQASNFGGEEEEYKKVEEWWNIKTMTGIFETVEKNHKNAVTNPVIQGNYEYYLIAVNYDKCNNLVYPCYVDFLKKRRDSNQSTNGGSYDYLRITDFKILEK